MKERCPQSDTPATQDVPEMDYRKLLWLYINHVDAEEGTTFIGKCYKTKDFTDEEWQELEALNNMREYSDITPL